MFSKYYLSVFHRSEMYNATVSTQFRLILECYLKHNEDHLQALMKQQNALKKLQGINLQIKNFKDVKDKVCVIFICTANFIMMRVPVYFEYLFIKLNIQNTKNKRCELRHIDCVARAFVAGSSH